MDAVEYEKHMCLKWMQYNPSTTGVLNRCSTIREQPVS